MATTPRHQFGDIVTVNLGQSLVLPKKLNQLRNLPFGVVGTGVVLTNLLPIAASHVVESQRCLRRRRLSNLAFRPIVYLALYRFRFAPSGALRRAVKAMTVDLKIVCVVRRARVAT